MKMGIDIGGSHIAMGLVDSRGKIIEKSEKRLTSTEKKNCEKFIEESILASVNQWIKRYSIDGIGIGSPGSIQNGIILEAGNLNIKNYPIIKTLQQKIQLPIKIRNDARCAAIAEHNYGCLKGTQESLFLTLGTGIGGAAFSQNKILKARGFGHMVIKKDGILCHCQRRGCFERYASMKALKNNLRNVLHLEETTKGQELLEIIQKNQPENKNYEIIEKVIIEYIENLSIGLVNLINIFRPEVVGIGGSFVYFEDVLLNRLKEKVKTEYRREVQIKTAILGNDAGIIGATL